MKKIVILLCLSIILFVNCTSYRPIINYSPITLSYEKSYHSSVEDIMLFMKSDRVPKEYDIVGLAVVPLKVANEYAATGNCLGTALKNITQEEAIAALRAEAFKRNADAVIDIHYESEMKDMPAFGFLTPSSGGFTGSGKVLAEFIVGTFVVWK